MHSLAITIAGSQLPTVALTTATYLLLTHPIQLERLLTEIRSSFKQESDINIVTTANLPYLGAVIDETLRIHHPTPIHLPRLIPSSGLNVDNEWIPGNVRKFTSNWLNTLSLTHSPFYPQCQLNTC